MYTVMNRIAVPAVDAEAFEERFAASMRAALTGVDGLLGSRLLRPRQEGGVYVAVTDFTGREAFAAWMRSESFRAAHGPSGGGGSADGAGGGVEMFETVVSVGA
ncbi:antibiotic biosynthesis monooxygenase family protein [Kitasatospora phosalacinea]|uniref:Antibiotic biosynthesis monooxygenase n=1 Tax=Kitasatospora phosalacinea TaxID=2065 RepID=A0A9W6UTY7_9ACTN|nr:antibiotic biosynthesis monooxygenase family protein [Kitasatospora phosalacinea]GLW59592.1 antibiotic biosynthesis monooxygenase [Kitasatospora phosalacinea]